MKTHQAYLIFLLITSHVQAQHALSYDPLQYKNQLGINASYFISQFINFDGYGYNEYPPYMLTYRRICEPGNIRVAIGAEYNSEEVESRYDYDSTIYTNVDYNFAVTAGWEWDVAVSKRWWIYYGADLGTYMLFENNEADNFSDGYAEATESKDIRLSVGPFVGIRFDLTPRISLTTETSLKVYHGAVDVHRSFTPSSADYPALPDETEPTVKSTFTTYLPPYTLILTIDL